MQIRKATMKDAEALLSLYEDLGYPTTASKLYQRLEMILSQPHYGCLLAERNGEILGFLGYAKLFFLKQMDLTIVFWLCQLQKKQDDKELLVG